MRPKPLIAMRVAMVFNSLLRRAGAVLLAQLYHETSWPAPRRPPRISGESVSFHLAFLGDDPCAARSCGREGGGAGLPVPAGRRGRGPGAGSGAADALARRRARR